MTQKTMISLGGLHFNLRTLPYNTLAKSQSFRWAKQDRVLAMAGLQYMGPGAETLSLSIEVPTDSRARFDAIAELQKLAAEGKPHRLISGGGYEGKGANLGLWVIESIDISQSEFLADGLPMAQSIAIKLVRHEELQQ